MSAETFWQATSAPIPHTAPLGGDRVVEVAVIGAGYCGLNAALELAEAGIEVAIVDALQLGDGASGRSGGFVSARFRMPADTVLSKFGQPALSRLQELSREAVRQVEENVAQYDLTAARLIKHGSVTAAVNQRHLDRVLRQLRQTQQQSGTAADIRILSRADIERETGSPRFVGGLLTPGGQGLHPMNYTLGLAKAAIDKGVTIYTGTPALRVDDDGSRMRIVTPSGSLRAKRLIIATNAYSLLTEATKPLAKGVIPFRSAVIATERLPEAKLTEILPGERMMFDTKRLLRWFRVVDGRLLVGGRGAGSPSADAQAYDHMRACMVDAFPQLSAVKLQYRWSGYVGITLEGLPHVGPTSDRVFIAGGCNGNGVAIASLLGRYAAKFAQGQQPDVGILHSRGFKTMPFHRFAAPGVRVATKAYQLLDAMGA